MCSKLLLLASMLTSALFFTGCMDKERAELAPAESNFLGIVASEEESYQHTGPDTVAIHTDELVARKNYSGKKVELLWGLITIKDY
ncbi:MAG: hypothetical protein AAGC73_10510 [Verrucomicrobiota bacterium]